MDFFYRLNSCLLFLLLAAPACAGSKSETDGDSETEAATETGAATETEAATETSAATEAATEPTTAEPTTDTGDGPTTGETEGGSPAGCGANDPAVQAAFDVELDGVLNLHDVSMPCTVDAVTTEADKSVTSLSCDDAGVPVLAKLILPVAPEGDVAWPVGEVVTLQSRSQDFTVYDEKEFQLRGSDDKLWAAGSQVLEAFPSAAFLPLVVELTQACGSGDHSSYRLDIELEGQSISLFSRQRGELAIDASESFAIDVRSAEYNSCCHSSEYFDLLVRRVKID